MFVFSPFRFKAGSTTDDSFTSTTGSPLNAGTKQFKREITIEQSLPIDGDSMFLNAVSTVAIA
jgi:hypothetical protein